LDAGGAPGPFFPICTDELRTAVLFLVQRARLACIMYNGKVLARNMDAMRSGSFSLQPAFFGGFAFGIGAVRFRSGAERDRADRRLKIRRESRRI